MRFRGKTWYDGEWLKLDDMVMTERNLAFDVDGYHVKASSTDGLLYAGKWNDSTDASEAGVVEFRRYRGSSGAVALIGEWRYSGDVESDPWIVEAEKH